MWISFLPFFDALVEKNIFLLFLWHGWELFFVFFFCSFSDGGSLYPTPARHGNSLLPASAQFHCNKFDGHFSTCRCNARPGRFQRSPPLPHGDGYARRDPRGRPIPRLCPHVFLNIIRTTQCILHGWSEFKELHCRKSASRRHWNCSSSARSWWVAKFCAGWLCSYQHFDFFSSQVFQHVALSSSDWRFYGLIRSFSRSWLFP